MSTLESLKRKNYKSVVPYLYLALVAELGGAALAEQSLINLLIVFIALMTALYCAIFLFER